MGEEVVRFHLMPPRVSSPSRAAVQNDRLIQLTYSEDEDIVDREDFAVKRPNVRRSPSAVCVRACVYVCLYMPVVCAHAHVSYVCPCVCCICTVRAVTLKYPLSSRVTQQPTEDRGAVLCGVMSASMCSAC